MSILKELSLFAKNYSILIVEDQSELNNELVEICQLFFKSVDYAFDGQEALEIFLKNPNKFDIILSDITMPKTNGVILSREIKSINRNQNIVILSAHNEVQYLVDLIDIGINQFVSKPFEEKELLFRLLKVCENIFYKKEYIKMVATSKSKEVNPQIVSKQIKNIRNQTEIKKIVKTDINLVDKSKENLSIKDINKVIQHDRITASNFLESMQNDYCVWSVMETQIEELLVLIDELHDEIQKVYLNNISTDLILNIASILRRIYSIFSFLDELTKLAKVIFELVVFLESLDINTLSNEKKSKLKILEFIYDDISRFIETVFVYKDTLDVLYLEDSLHSSIEQLKITVLDKQIEEEELELF